MKRSIYEIQNPKDYEPYFTKNKLQENIIQALANMGQRIGIKGDGIKYNSFTFKELIDDDSVADNNENVGYIYLDNEDNITIGIGSKNMNIYNSIIDDDKSKNKPSYKYKSVNNRLIFDNEFTLEIPINNIEKYATNSILSNDSEYFTELMVGKYFGYDDNDKNNCEYIYNKFEINTNRLIKAYRAFYAGSNATSDFYCLLKLEYKGFGIDKKLNDVPKYELTFQIFDTNYLSDELKRRFENSFIYSYINDNTKQKFNFLDINYLNEEELESYNDENEDSILSSSILSLMLNYANNKYDYGTQVITYTYDTNNNIFLYTDNANFDKIEKNILSLYGINLVERINFIGNDIAISYENLIKYFNDKYYFSNKRTLLLKILFAIYYKIDSTSGSNQHNYMFIPLDYKFHYICNSENEIEIYYSNNIYVNLMNLAAEYNTKEIFDHGNIIYSYNGESKVKVYNFEIDYNKEYNDVINEIQVKDLYTLPYINAEYNWSINDKNTYVSALGKDAGNPNIIIVYSAGTSEASHTILNNIYNKDQIDTEWELKKFNVSNDYFTGIENEDSNENPTCYAWIPKISVKNIKYLYDSIIISISNINCIENSNYAKNYNGKYIVSIWTLSEINDVDNVLPEYIYLVDHTENNSEVALTFGTIANNLSDIEEVNKNIFDCLLLKAKTNTLAQRVSNENINNWIIFKNKSHNEYINGITQEGSNINSDYKNDLNFMFHFSDTIKLNDTKNNITYSQANKYLGAVNNVSNKINVTNKAYPKYILEYSGSDDEEEETTTVTVIENNSKLVIKQQVLNVPDGQETISTDYIEDQINYVDNIFRSKNITNVSKNIYTNNYYFNDYVFNDNVPNLDLKEIIVRNINTLNRVNILSLDQQGNIYNSYIGCNFDDNSSDKNILHIASSMTNINIGSETLINEESRYNFKKQNTLSLDFDNILFNSKSNIISNNNIWTKQECQGITFYSTAIRPIGIYENYEHSIFGYTNEYISALISTQSSFASKDRLKDNLSDPSSYILNELFDATTTDVNINNINNILSSTPSIFLLNNSMYENDDEKTDKDSIFRRINIYTNNNTNTISNSSVRTALLREYGELMENSIDYQLNENNLEIDLSEYTGVNYAIIIYPNKVGENIFVNSLGDPIKIDLDNKKISAIHYGSCMVLLTSSRINVNDINDLDKSLKTYVLYISVDLRESITAYTCLNINKLLKYKLGKDINENELNIEINTKFNKLLTFDGYYYLILNNEKNLNNINNSIYYYDNELSIMYYETNDKIVINIGFERDNYDNNYQIGTKFNIIKNTVLNTNLFINQ